MPIDEMFGVLLRWVHISAVAVLIGGVLYARLVVAPAMRGLEGEARRELGERLAAGFRPWVMGAVAALLASGLYNLTGKSGVPAQYFHLFGVKMLLALHVFAVAFLLGKPGVEETKRNRWLTGIVVSGVGVLAISAWLRWIAG